MAPNPGWFKPAVPKRILFFAAASVWAFAAYRVFLLALRYIPEGPLPVWVITVLGLAGIAVFFNLVFLRVSRKYIRRIAEMEQKNPCFFAFFGWKSYLLIAFMAGMGIVFAQYDVIPLFLQGIFYISLSGSLLLSALMFINAGVLYREVNPENTNPEL